VTDNRFAGRRIALGVTGSIAAYKALGLASQLTADGADVDVILTPGAASLVSPLAFQALTHRPVVTSLWDPQSGIGLDHLEIAHGAEALVIAPATANALAELALGLAGNALSTTALAVRGPLLVAPAMEPDMWQHPAVAAHVATLIGRGALIVGPEFGRMASGKSGVGRLASQESILDALESVFVPRDLVGRRVMVTAGPTVEPIDPVRAIANRSSGRMGFEIAAAARQRGADVVLVTGPVALVPPWGVTVVEVQTGLQMRDQVLQQISGCDAVVMAAAVADFRPAAPSLQKLKKSEGTPDLRLVANPDILVEIHNALSVVPTGEQPVRVGFAAETDDFVAQPAQSASPKGLT
jgi:phosphopantothenoylcysteine decarboxylase / phosphopantothenate---cysteine ligase